MREALPVQRAGWGFNGAVRGIQCAVGAKQLVDRQIDLATCRERAVGCFSTGRHRHGHECGEFIRLGKLHGVRAIPARRSQTDPIALVFVPFCAIHI